MLTFTVYGFNSQRYQFSLFSKYIKIILNQISLNFNILVNILKVQGYSKFTVLLIQMVYSYPLFNNEEKGKNTDNIAQWYLYLRYFVLSYLYNQKHVLPSLCEIVPWAGRSFPGPLYQKNYHSTHLQLCFYLFIFLIPLIPSSAFLATKD